MSEGIRVRRKSSCVFRVSENGDVDIVALDRLQSYWKIEGLAARIWLALSADEERDWSRICREIGTQGELSHEQWQQETQSLLRDLIRENLISAHAESTAGREVES